MRPRFKSAKQFYESDVNILPLIDVLFVVLLFFMLSSLVLTNKNQIIVERPANSRTEQVIGANKILTIALRKDMKLYLDDDLINPSELSAKIVDLSRNNSVEHVLVDADKESIYGDVMDILDIVKESGLNSVGLVVNKKGGDG